LPRPFALIDRVDTHEGVLELRQRGERDFMIRVGTRVLMSTTFNRSELALAELGCAPIKTRRAPRVLIGGLGLGFTLRAALDLLPASASVDVAELNPAVKKWCETALAVLTGGAVFDERVCVLIEDVGACIRRAAQAGGQARYDAIVVDLYEGPKPLKPGQRDPLYGGEVLKHTHAALSKGGVYAVWAEDANRAFEQRLSRVGFQVQVVRAKGGGPTHVVYLAMKG
jgi:spermidine synthase